MKTKLSSILLAAVLALTGCSNGGTSQPEQTGGSGSGGQSRAGGTSGSGGVTSTGGTSSSGGVSGSGGSSSSGGSGTGGASSTGGKIGTGGTASGGTTGSGGTSAAGGSGAGGASGGASGSGGVMATGGNTAKGGADGGMPDAKGSGGSNGTGGSSGAGGGTSVTVGASGYPAAGASGQAAPTGSGTTVTVLPWAGFKSALSFTFDDTNSSQISHYSELEAESVHYTFFLWTNKSTEMGSSVWPQAVKDGHELGNHTNTHQSNANASDIQTAEDTIKSKFGVTAYSFAAPNGDASYQTVVPPMKILTTNRTAGNSGGISMTDNPSSKQYALPCIIPNTGAQTSAMTSSISSGISGGKWNIFLVHGFTGGSDGAYQPVDIAQFTGTVSWAKTQGNIWIDTVGSISAYWIGGYKFSALTATKSGTDTTWTWKTSDFATPFPPGKYLRVTTNGGTLKQGSTVLQWDDHGYYEVSLDAGTLTLSAQ